MTWLGETSAIFGASDAALPQNGEEFRAFLSSIDRPKRQRHLAACFGAEGGSVSECEYRVRGVDGRFRWVNERARGVGSRDGQQDSRRLLAGLRIVDGRKKRDAELIDRANHHGLTGLFNRPRLREFLDFALGHCKRYEETGLLLAIGIDGLSAINRKYGLAAGDKVLIDVARRIEMQMRESDYLGHLGDDRYGMVLTRSASDGSEKLAERLLGVVSAEPVVHGGVEIPVSACIGLIAFDKTAGSSLELLERLDRALAKAKAKGPNAWQRDNLSAAEIRSRNENLRICEETHRAFRERRLKLCFQPLVDAQSRAVAHYECLALIVDPRDGSLLSAQAFVPALESLGQMRGLDIRVLEQVFDVLVQHQDIRLAFNVSGSTISDRAWLRAFLSRLGNDEKLARRLIVEITETTALWDVEDSARFVGLLRDYGCSVALDDFGAGHATFHQLGALAVDMVKIDGKVIRGLGNDPAKEAFLVNLLTFAHAHDLKTAAEFVETPEQADLLSAMGVDFLQGYLFGKPQRELR
jgi:diguanylate cyclase (GGDEF)-like protein